MAFEYLDLENKLLAPTQTLLSKLQVEWSNSYSNARQLLSESHDTVATLGLEWYNAPLLTTTKWYDHSVTTGNELYAKVTDDILPQVEVKYDEMLVVANDFVEKTQDSFNYVIENPEKVTTESIASLTESLSSAGNISSELASGLQAKAFEITSLLVEQPMQTIETAYTELLSTLLNQYFEIVTNIISTL